MKSRFLPSLTTLVPLILAPALSQAAGFGINATRLIYPEGEKSITATLRNTGDSTVYLVQSAVSLTSARHQPAPFDVTPPLFRLEAESKHQVRILFRGTSLPADRESVFYFRASAIPALKAGESEDGAQHVQAHARFGVGKSIKLFYRPKNLPGNSLSAQRGLKVSAVQKGIQISNPSPYYVSFADLKIAGKRLSLEKAEEKMLPPFSSYVWHSGTVKGKVEWLTIDDHGGHNAFSQQLP